mmetsp:Transcript_24888/g.65328  ORF Transcript_24888/g.65328 Transcript_24888/m.65328 type:complete len:102 (-) Transcript_24888:487-792(-)
MLAWMTAESISETLTSGRVVYYSRSRKALWRKGDTSGQTQRLVAFRWDCDRDAVLVQVDQAGVACHTGRRSCFYFEAEKEGVKEVLEVETEPEVLYGTVAK